MSTNCCYSDYYYRCSIFRLKIAKLLFSRTIWISQNIEVNKNVIVNLLVVRCFANCLFFASHCFLLAKFFSWKIWSFFFFLAVTGWKKSKEVRKKFRHVFQKHYLWLCVCVCVYICVGVVVTEEQFLFSVYLFAKSRWRSVLIGSYSSQNSGLTLLCYLTKRR